jgi:FAD/FMN-containing dehydrogenase
MLSFRPEESPHNIERKRLLQDCLPGVTLYDSAQSHYRRQSSFRNHGVTNSNDNSYRSEGVQVQPTHVTNTQKKAKRALGDNDKMDAHMDDSSVHFLWVGHEDDGDKYGDSPSSLRQAVALARARRHSERMWTLYFKTFVVAAVFLMFWWEIKSPIRTRGGRRRNKTSHNMSTAAGAPSMPLSTRDSTFLFLEEGDVMQRKKQEASSNAVEYIPTPEHREKILEALKNLDEEIKGDVILLSNKTKFIEASSVWQQQLHLSPPLAVIEAKTPKDVELALPILAGLARDFGLRFRTRSGGHSYMSGFSTVSGGVMLSLAKLDFADVSNISSKATTVSENTTLQPSQTPDVSSRHYATAANNSSNSKIITIQPGLKVEDFMQQITFENGYGGVVASAGGVGMGGFILGGGYGLMSRMYGLAIDNVVGMEVVTTDGHSQDVANGIDLFWALRGAGGGNLGVVTSFHYRVYPTNDIKLEASVKMTLAELVVFLQRLGELEQQLRPEFNLQIHGYEGRNNDSISTFPPLRHGTSSEHAEDEEGFVTVSMFWMGDCEPEMQTGMKYLKDMVVPLLPNNLTKQNVVYYYFSWSGSTRQREQDKAWSSVYYAQSWNGFLLPMNNTQDVWDDIQQSLRAVFRYSKYTSPKIDLWGGAISMVPSNATAFPHRNALYSIAIELLVPDFSDAEAASDEANLIHAIWPSISRHLQGVYSNYPMPSLSNDEYPKAYWGGNLDRLMLLKQKYDPYHVLTFSQSIPTAKATSSSTQKRMDRITQFAYWNKLVL